ncbi:LOW QUALITY PROTEIN: hypothetical protein HID58_094658, partial [Brassica napus]
RFQSYVKKQPGTYCPNHWSAFPPGKMPNIYNALVVKGRDTLGQEINVTCEVQQLLGNNRVRSCSYERDRGEGMDVVDMGNPLSVPVGGATLGRIFQYLWPLSSWGKSDYSVGLATNYGIDQQQLPKLMVGVSVFGGVGERTREGNDLYMEMKESGVINELNRATPSSLVYGQRNEPPGARMRVGLTALTMAEIFPRSRLTSIIDNIFRFVQAGSEVSALLGRMPAAVGYQPTLVPKWVLYKKEDDFYYEKRVHNLYSSSIYPAVDPLDSRHYATTSNRWRGHYETAQQVSKLYNDIIAILGLDELSEEDRLTVARARRLSVSYHNLFSFSGKYVGLAETIRGFNLILSGEFDSLPEQAFYLVGNIEEATAKATNLEME